jgi:hypothetical protein
LNCASALPCLAAKLNLFIEVSISLRRHRRRKQYKVHRVTVWRLLRSLGLTHKRPQALEQKRKDMAGLL